MQDLPKKINSISAGTVIGHLDFRATGYTFNEGEETEKFVSVHLPRFDRPTVSNKIVEDTNDFINGFKVVQTANGEYGYVRESDNILLPYRYDVASDFNQYGFAMVGKDGSVSWIDKSFKYLNSFGDMVDEDLDDDCSEFKGWGEVNNFSEGEIPLSRVYDGRNTYGITYYFGINGQFQTFCEYNGEINDFLSVSRFNEGTDFDKTGYAMANGYMLFAKGYYLSYKDLIKLCKEKGFINIICEDAEKCLEKEKGRILKK